MIKTANGVVEILATEAEPVHIHGEAELIYVLEGSADVFICNECFHAEAGDVILFNSEEIHGWNGKKNLLFCRVYIGYYSLKSAIGKQKIVFDCNSVKTPGKDYSRIKSVLDSILNACISKNGDFQVKSLYYSLWEIIRNQYLLKDERESTEEDRKIEEIVNYINEHYKEHLNLSDFAARWYMSQSAFSRYFKNKTRQGFAEYIRGVRVGHAKQDLIQNNHTITEIAYNNGFTNVSVFNKNFKEETGLTPSAYRMKNSGETGGDQRNMQFQQLKNYLEHTGGKHKQYSGRTVIQLDARRCQENRIHKIEGINGGFLSDFLSGKIQDHIRLVASQLNIQYIKIYNIIDAVNDSYVKRRMGRFGFEAVDNALDFLVDHNLRAYLEFPGRKKKIIASVGGDALQEERTAFTILNEWKKVLEEFMQHIIERYTLKVVQEWKFEIWKDSEQQQDHDVEAYLKLYEVTYHIIRKYIPQAMIGACNQNVDAGKERLKDILLFWKEKRIIPDFLTMMSYPYSVRRESAGTYVLYHIESDTHFVKKDIKNYNKLLQELDYPDIPLVISEWNTSLSQQNYYNDSCAKACHMLRQMIDMHELGAEQYYSDISDCTMQFYDSKKPLIGAAGLLSKDGILKPAYFALEFWVKLGDCILGSGENYTAATHSDGSYQMLLYNAKEFNRNYFVKEENQIYVQELNTIFKDKENIFQKIELYNIQNRKYCVRIFRLKETEGTVLSEWCKLGNDDKLIREEIEYLKNMSVPRMQVMYINVNSHRLELDITLEPNEIVMIRIC